MTALMAIALIELRAVPVRIGWRERHGALPSDAVARMAGVGGEGRGVSRAGDSLGADAVSASRSSRGASGVGGGPLRDREAAETAGALALLGGRADTGRSRAGRANRGRSIGSDDQLVVRPVVRGSVGRLAVVVWAVVGAGGVKVSTLPYVGEADRIEDPRNAKGKAAQTRKQLNRRKGLFSEGDGVPSPQYASD